ncbi:MAG: arsenosugar biosynthesis arsenite methyltransferase ArsM [Myxococcales bacterium]|nr:arsenosugar biosynthesis arsenite methyltransferase ArsM [Myxococcales bacterium]
MQYLEATRALYAAAAQTPDDQLCCVSTPPWRMPDLDIPDVMHEMNYGCGTTVHPRDVPTDAPVLYIGVGGGLELLQFASLARRPTGVIGVDNVPEMLDVCRRNLNLAEQTNPWLTSDTVDLREGDALKLPIDDDVVGLVAQNCLFNIFREEELDRALAEAHRVLRPEGALSLSDPITPRPIPDHLRDDDRLRAMCLSGALTLEDYLARIVAAGFGTIEVRGRRPYRLLDQRRFGLQDHLLLESIEVVAYKTPVPSDGPCIFTGRTAIWFGEAHSFDDGKGHVLRRDVPVGVCDKTADQLACLSLAQLMVTDSTWHYDGGGCC